MTEINLLSTFHVELADWMGSDQFICEAARVSTLGSEAIASEESAGLIRFLMKNRHGSPFEHGAMTFRIKAPIMVWREFMRHRVGFSYNEQSGRYMELSPDFYIPPRDRFLKQVGRPGEYRFEKGEEEQYILMHSSLSAAYGEAWWAYQSQLEHGIAKEVARLCLPVATYSTAYVTCNPRSLMHFLSLRVKSELSTFPSFPQWEINQVANQMEEIFANLYPATHSAYLMAGRVAP